MLQMCRDSLFIGSTMNSMISAKLPTHGPPLEGVVFHDACITQVNNFDVTHN